MTTSKRRAGRSRATVAIRAARRADLPVLARFGAKLAREHHAMDPDRFFLPEEPLEEGYAWWLGKELSNRRAVVLAVDAGDAVVGYAYGRIEPRDWNTLRDRCGVGVDLWVEPEARGAGVGARLVEALAAELASLGAARVVLNVASSNSRARRLFGAIGFRETMVEMTRETAPPGKVRRGSAGAAAWRRGAGRRRPEGAPTGRPGSPSRNPRAGSRGARGGRTLERT